MFKIAHIPKTKQNKSSIVYYLLNYYCLDPALLWAVVLLWLGCRQAATAPIRPLAWEPLYAMGVDPKRQKKKKVTTW